jgi:hypothetical protein
MVMGAARRVASLLLAEDRHRAAVVHAARKHVADDLAQHGGAVGVVQRDGEADHEAEVSSRVHPSLEQRDDLGDFDAQPVTTLEVAGVFLVRPQGGAMLGNSSV